MTPISHFLKKLKGLTAGFNPHAPHPLEGMGGDNPAVAGASSPPINAPAPRLRLPAPSLTAAAPQQQATVPAPSPIQQVAPPPAVPQQMPPTPAPPKLDLQLTDDDEQARVPDAGAPPQALTPLEDQLGRVRAQREMKRDGAPIPERTGRGKSILAGIAQGALRGAASGGGVGAVIGGAATGGIVGGVDKNFDERMWRDERLAEEEKSLSHMQQQQA